MSETPKYNSYDLAIGKVDNYFIERVEGVVEYEQDEDSGFVVFLDSDDELIFAVQAHQLLFMRAVDE